MRRGNFSDSRLVGKPADATHQGKFGARCTCAGGLQAARGSAPAGQARRSLGGGLLTVCGLVGWLCVPKCPLCLAAYFAIGSGITLSIAQSQMLRQLALVAAAGLVLAGTWLLGRHGWQLFRARVGRSFTEESR